MDMENKRETKTTKITGKTLRKVLFQHLDAKKPCPQNPFFTALRDGITRNLFTGQLTKFG